MPEQVELRHLGCTRGPCGSRRERRLMNKYSKINTFSQTIINIFNNLSPKEVALKVENYTT